MVLRHVPERLHARQRALDAQLQQVVGQQPAAAAAAVGALADGVGRHVVVMVAAGAEDRARDLELPAGGVAHARGARHVAGIVVGQHHVVVLRRVEAQPALPEQAVGDLADVLRHGVGGVEEVERPGQGVEEAVGDPPGVAAFAEHDAPRAEPFGRLADAQRQLAHVLVAADEHAEVGGLGGVRTQGPGDAGLVQHLGVADQAVDVRLGEEVGRGRDQQHLRARGVERERHRHAGVLLDLLGEALQGVGQGRLGQAQVVADGVHLADDLVAVLLALADRVHDLARRHRDLGGVDAVGAVHRAAAALRALVEVAVPVVQHLLGQVLGADQPREPAPGESVVAAVDMRNRSCRATGMFLGSAVPR